MSAKSDRHLSEERPARFTTTLGGLILTLGAIAAVIYASTLIISRTEGFREIVRDRISERLGMRTTINSVMIDKRMRLVLRGVTLSAREGEDTPAGLKAAVVTISFHPSLDMRPKYLCAEDAKIVFVVDKRNNMTPKRLAPISVAIGDILQVATIGPDTRTPPRTSRPEAQKSLSELFTKDIIVELKNASAEWNMGNGALLDRMENIDLTARPLKARDGRAFYIYFEATPLKERLGAKGRIVAEIIRKADGTMFSIRK